MNTKIYTGTRSKNGLRIEVCVDGKPLNPRHDLHNHSPNGFEWGYGGSGPAQLALAMCCEHLQDDEAALQVYQDFKWKWVAPLKGPEWVITSNQLGEIINEIRTEQLSDPGPAAA